MAPPGAAAPARKRLAWSALHPWQESGLAKIRGFGEALDASRGASRFAGLCRPAASAGFSISGFRLSRPRVNRDHARGIARTWRACIILPQGATGQAIRLCRRRYSALTTPAVTGCSRESEQSENGAGGMVPLYAARVQDLGL